MIRILRSEFNGEEERVSKILSDFKVDQNISVFEREEKFSFSCLDDDTYIGGAIGKITDNACHIELLGVIDSYRKQKIGSNIIEFVIEYAKKMGCIQVTVNTLNFQARLFYEKQGFKVFGVLDDFPKKGFQKFYMRKVIALY